jgi:GT2 family glycosyltransferase
MFSIIIPTWNNLALLKLCLESLQQNSFFENQIVLHINEGSDGTRDWLETDLAPQLGKTRLAFTESSTNIGICQAVNLAFGKTHKDYIIYLNDDMYVLPDWDKYLYDEIEKLKQTGENIFMLSATMIEPRPTNDPNIIVADYGQDAAHFQKEKLLSTFATYKMGDWSGASWPPLVISREAWLAIGGFSIEFSPGMYSDPDFSMKLWHIGCRIFKGIGASRVYHFQAKSTGRIKKNNGRRQFMQKWGLPASYFYKHYLRMGEPFSGNLTEPTQGLAWAKLKAKLNTLLGEH